MRLAFHTLALAVITSAVYAQSSEKVPAGFKSLFNGSDFTNWKLPDGDNGHWKIKYAPFVSVPPEHNPPKADDYSF